MEQQISLSLSLLPSLSLSVNTINKLQTQVAGQLWPIDHCLDHWHCGKTLRYGARFSQELYQPHHHNVALNGSHHSHIYLQIKFVVVALVPPPSESYK